MTFRTFQHFTRRSQRGLAFTVVELMVAVSIMTLIVLALYGMFDQVQKALRGNVAQVDVLEGGRAAMEMMTREMEQIQAGNVLNQTNLYAGLGYYGLIRQEPFPQELLGVGEYRTNVLQEVYFLSHFNRQWTGTGYRVLASNPKNGLFDRFAFSGVGTLARLSTNIHDSDLTRTKLYPLVMDREPGNLTNYQRLVDGVVHLRIRAFDALGRPMTYLSNLITNGYPGVSLINEPNTFETRYGFDGTPVNVPDDPLRPVYRVPAYLELELGILEPQVLDRLKSFPTPAAAANFLAKQTGKIHLFQQRIPIRTAK